MEDIKNIYLKNNLTLEPRIQEYLKKLSFFKKNNIEPSFDLDREYSISRDDKIKIKAYLKGNDDLYLLESQDKYITPENNMFKIKYEDYKKDPRYERLQKKIQRDKDANMGKSLNGELTGFNNITHTKFITDDEYQKDEESNFFLDNKPYSSDFSLNVRQKSKRVYDSHPPEIQYKNYKSWGNDDLPHNNNLDSIINNMNKFRTHTNTINQYPITQDMNYSSPKLNTTKLAAVPLKSKNINVIGGTRDIDIENCLIKGLPERDAKFKSLGYPNYSDHSFNYISQDIQDPKHVVLPFPRGGLNSRLENDFKRAKPYFREIF